MDTNSIIGTAVGSTWNSGFCPAFYGNNLCTSVDGEYLIAINKNGMKESKKELFKIVYNKTVVTEYVYEVLAENEEDAKKRIADGGCNYKSTTILEEVVEIKQ